MKPAAFDYVRAETVAQAVALHAESGGDARYLAGGQSLLPALNFRLDAPARLIDLNGIAGLSGVRMDGDALVIGALTRHATVARDPLIRAHLPLIAQAMDHVAHPAIRNRGTFGGSVALADPAAEMPACVLALGGVIVAEGARGRRQIAADDFFLGSYETALQSGEVLVEVRLPLPHAQSRAGFAEIARRKGDYATVGLALMTGPDPRVVWFGVSDRPLRDPAAETALRSGTDAAAVVLDGLDVWGDLHSTEATKRHLARVLMRRVIEGLA
jgi:carbon-monoxide dehydrogenase medium subunit